MEPLRDKRLPQPAPPPARRRRPRLRDALGSKTPDARRDAGLWPGMDGADGRMPAQAHPNTPYAAELHSCLRRIPHTPDATHPTARGELGELGQVGDEPKYRRRIPNVTRRLSGGE